MNEMNKQTRKLEIVLCLEKFVQKMSVDVSCSSASVGL